MWHIVYLTRNLVNGNIYIGKHSTWKLDDGYLGSGTSIQKAIKKYGKENFERIILHYCLTDEHALEIERMIVDESFIKQRNNYNSILGGGGIVGLERTDEHNKKISEALVGKVVSKESRMKSSATKKAQNKKGENAVRYGAILSDESKQKMSMTKKGKKWVSRNNETKQVLPSEIESYINDGWTPGRTISEKHKQTLSETNCVIMRKKIQEKRNLIHHQSQMG